MQSVIDSYDERRFEWMITLRESGEALGGIGVVSFREDTAAAEVGYCLSEAY